MHIYLQSEEIMHDVLNSENIFYRSHIETDLSSWTVT